MTTWCVRRNGRSGLPRLGNEFRSSVVSTSEAEARMMEMGLELASSARSRIKWRALAAAAAAAEATPAIKKAVKLELATVEGLPDLFHPEPRYMIDREALASQLAFAFAGGDASDGIRKVLAEVVTAPTEWDAASLARHLYVEDFVRIACRVELDGKPVDTDRATLAALLTRPPKDVGIRDFRRGILAELVDRPGDRAGLVELHRRLRALRSLFMIGGLSQRHDSTRHRLEVLRAVRNVIEHLAAAFTGSSSGLSRLQQFGDAAIKSEVFRQLCDLLDHDSQRANVTLDIRLGGDGRIRAVAAKSLVEATDNRYYFGTFERWWMRLSLWLRGYRFSDEALIDHWIDGVYAQLEDWLPALFQVALQLELYLSALGFRDLCKERGLEVCLPELHDSGEPKLEGLFNPLLLVPEVKPVPCDLHRSGPGTTTIITGPNSGGKTRLLQAIGLSQLLAQVGFFVPAKRARLRPVPMVFCSLVQHESYDQSEGRLGTELVRIRRLFEETKPGSLVILDELCSGTNPSEGEEIFMLVVELLHELAPETVVSSHFLDFASRLAEQADPRLRFLQVELDAKEQPTYGFVPGVARTSLASKAAARLGVNREELLALIKKNRD